MQCGKDDDVENNALVEKEYKWTNEQTKERQTQWAQNNMEITTLNWVELKEKKITNVYSIRISERSSILI